MDDFIANSSSLVGGAKNGEPLETAMTVSSNCSLKVFDIVGLTSTGVALKEGGSVAF